MPSASHNVVRRRTARSGARRRVGLAAVGLATGLALAATPIAPSHAGDVPPPTIPDAQAAQVAQQSKGVSISGATSLTSTKRKKLGIQLSASSSADGGTVVVELNRSTERHAWMFKVSKKTLTLASSGKGKLVTKKQIKPFGSIKLTIKPSGKWKTKKCQGEVVSKRRSLKMVGLFKFDSSSAWGAVGGKKVTFKGGSVVRSTGYECPGDGDGGGGDGPDDPCPGASAMWNAYDEVTGANLMSTWNPDSTAKAPLIGSRYVELAKPKRAVRTDLRIAQVPAPQFTDGGSSATVSATAKAPAVGSATLDGMYGFPMERPCKTGSYVQTTWAADYVNGAKKLTMKMTAFGNITVSDGSMVGTIMYSGPA